MSRQWFPHYPGDYMRDTGHLTLVEDGAYRRLLDYYYSSGKPLPTDRSKLCRICRAFDEYEKEAIGSVIDQFFTIKSGAYHNHRADKEIEKAESVRSKNSDNAKKLDSAISKKRRAVAGASGRWGSDNDIKNKKNRSERLSAARKIATHTALQWEAMKEFHNGVCVECGACEHIVKDHIKPLYQGGSDGIENIQPLCRKCNASKGPDSTDHRLDGWENACLTPA